MLPFVSSAKLNSSSRVPAFAFHDCARYALLVLLLAMLAVWQVPVCEAAMFEADLRGDQYPISGDRTTSASGLAEFDIVEKLGQPAIAYSIQINGLDLDWNQTATPDDDVIRLHIHGDWPNESGPMRFGIINPEHDDTDRVIDPVAGTVTGIWDVDDFGPFVPSAVLSELVAGEWYLNVHTNLYDTGEIRGQILSTSIPEPTSGLLLAAMLLLAWRRRRVRS